MLHCCSLYIYIWDLCLGVFMNERYVIIIYIYIMMSPPVYKRVPTYLPTSLRRRRYCNGETIEKTFRHIMYKSPFLLSNNTTQHTTEGGSPNRVIESDLSGTTPTRGTTIYWSPDSLLLLAHSFRLVPTRVWCPAVPIYACNVQWNSAVRSRNLRRLG